MKSLFGLHILIIAFFSKSWDYSIHWPAYVVLRVGLLKSSGHILRCWECHFHYVSGFFSLWMTSLWFFHEVLGASQLRALRLCSVSNSLWWFVHLNFSFWLSATSCTKDAFLHLFWGFQMRELALHLGLNSSSACCVDDMFSVALLNIFKDSSLCVVGLFQELVEFLFIPSS